MGIKHGCLTGIPYHPSTHYNERPEGTVIDLLVIHCISLPPRQFGTPYIKDFFMGELDCTKDPYFAALEGVCVSAHVVISRLGEIAQYVPFDQRAWHAGASSFQGRENCNDFSIGIELEGMDDLPFTAVQYQQLIKVTQVLMQTYPGITAERIVGHQTIAPERKTDPGVKFDWLRYKEALFAD